VSVLIYVARRFKKQIFLSLDLPPGFMTMGEGMRLTLEVEKRAVEILKNLETPQAS
jgi:proteasome assembly chaperone 4